MSDPVDAALGEHIRQLSVGEDVLKEQEAMKETADGGDHLLEEELGTPGLPERILGSEDTEDAGTHALSDDESHEATAEEKEDYQKLYEEAQKAADGRLGEINRLRDESREVSKNIQTMREMFIREQESKQKNEWEKAREQYEQQQREYYGEDVVDDPHVRFLRDQMDQMREEQYRADQEREGRLRSVREQYEAQKQQEAQWNTALTTLQQQEEQFATEHEDYNDAYKYAKEKRREMYMRRGYAPNEAEQAVFDEERYLMQEQLSRGGNVAEEVYRLAQDYGWSKPEGQDEDSGAPDMSNSRPDFDKIRAGLGQSGIGQMNGKPASAGDSKFMTAEKFYDTVPEHIRAEVHANPEQFEMLARYGKVEITW